MIYNKNVKPKEFTDTKFIISVFYTYLKFFSYLKKIVNTFLNFR